MGQDTILSYTHAQDNLPAEELARFGKKARSGANQRGRTSRQARSESLRQGARHLFGFGGILVTEFQAQQPRKRRIAQCAPVGNFRRIKTGVIMPRRQLDDRIFGHKGLHDDLAAARRASRPPGHLRQHLEGTFGGERVGQVQAHVRQHNADQRHQRQIQPFGEHLRSDQHIRLMISEMRQNQIVRILLAGRVPIPAQRARRRKQRQHLALDLFAAQPIRADLFAFAIWAGFGHLARVVAAMTAQLASAVQVLRQRRFALRACQRRAAITAKNVGRRAAPVEKKNRLFAAFQRFGQGFQQDAAENAPAAGFELFAHVHDGNGRQTGAGFR